LTNTEQTYRGGASMIMPNHLNEKQLSKTLGEQSPGFQGFLKYSRHSATSNLCEREETANQMITPFGIGKNAFG